jgi:hypothetical protein
MAISIRLNPRRVARQRGDREKGLFIAGLSFRVQRIVGAEEKKGTIPCALFAVSS